MIRLFSFSGNFLHEIQFESENLKAAIEMAAWVDALSPTSDERELLEQLLKTEVPEADDVDEIEDSARCFIDPAGIHVYTLFLSHSEGRLNTVSVACILQTEKLITIRDEKLADFRLFCMRAKRGQIEVSNPSELLISLMEQKVESLADTVEGIHKRLESISATVLNEPDEKLEDIVTLLGTSEDSNGKVRLCLMDTQRNISFLQRHMRSGIEIHETSRQVAKDIDTLLSHSTFLFDKINFLMNFTQGYINIQQNQIIKTFSIAAVVFLPPTLVASSYGMNFELMPELSWSFGYPMAIGLMILSGITPYLYFKRKGWL